MRRSALELDRFYRTRQGVLAQRMIARRLAAIWPDVSGLDVLGLGFATPYMEPAREKARRCVALMPAAQGAIAPAAGRGRIALGDECRMPFPDALFDRVLVVHLLEETESLTTFLRETWRVMAPEGRLVIVSAARSGVWAWMDRTPFGHGRPFSRSQLSRLLDAAMFEPAAWSRAVYAPPWNWSSGPTVSNIWEKTGEHLWPGLGGVIMVEAIKRTAAISPRTETARILRPALEARREGGLSPRSTPHEPSRTRGSS